MKKAFLVFLSVVLVTTVFLVKQQESVAQAKQLEYSGAGEKIEFNEKHFKMNGAAGSVLLKKK